VLWKRGRNTYKKSYHLLERRSGGGRALREHPEKYGGQTVAGRSQEGNVERETSWRERGKA